MNSLLFPRTIPRTNGDSVVSAKVTSEIGQIFKGEIIVNISSKKHQFRWEAKYGGEGRWSVGGEGATVRGARVPNRSEFPFTMDPLFNNGLREVIANLLNEHRKLSKPSSEGAIKAPAAGLHAENGGIAKTQAEKPAAKGPVLQPVEEKKPPVPRVLPVVPPEEPVLPVSKPVTIAVAAEMPPKREISPVSPDLKTSAGGGALIVRVDRIKPFPGQPRKHFDVDELGSLADSLKQEGQQAPVIVVKSGDPDYDYELVDGERRWRAAKLIGLKELFAVLTTVEDAGKQHLKAVILNFNRAEHPPIEVSNALHYQMTEGGKTSSELAAALGKSVAWVYQHLSLQKLHQDLQRLLGPPTPKEERTKTNGRFPMSNGRNQP